MEEAYNPERYSEAEKLCLSEPKPIMNQNESTKEIINIK